MTVDQHAKMIIGDFVLTIAKLQAELDMARGQLSSSTDDAQRSPHMPIDPKNPNPTNPKPSDTNPNPAPNPPTPNPNPPREQ